MSQSRYKRSCVGSEAVFDDNSFFSQIVSVSEEYLVVITISQSLAEVEADMTELKRYITIVTTPLLADDRSADLLLYYYHTG